MGKSTPDLESLRWCIGPPLRAVFARLLSSDSPEQIERAVSAFRERFTSVGLFENIVYAGIPEVLDALNGLGHVLYIATSKAVVYAERIVEHFYIRKYFHGIYGSQMDGTLSDKAVLISHILQNEAISSNRTVMVGDREHDIIGARANRVFGIGVLWGYGTREELEASGASICISQPNELISAIEIAESSIVK
jgi:phosphoglycolate phosphatase